MRYKQPLRRKILSPDEVKRKVLVALEVLDPLSQTLVSSNLTVRAKGWGAPVVSWSGRFVWLEEGGTWPEEISVEPVGLPFEDEFKQPAEPADLAQAKPQERLVRIVLRPTPAADFSDVTAIRGQLRESLADSSPPVTDAKADLAWFDKNTGKWIPSPEQSGVTNPAGEFAAFLRLQPLIDEEADLQGRLLKVRVQLTRGSVTRATPD